MPKRLTPDAEDGVAMLTAALRYSSFTSVHASTEGYYFHFKSPGGTEIDVLATRSGLKLWDGDLGGPFEIPYHQLPDAREGDV